MLRLLLALAILTLATPAAALPPGQPIVIGAGYDLPSKVLGDTRRLNIYLPASYATGTRTYPVIYLLDGGEAEDFHHITGLLQVGQMNGYLADVIVVGIAGVDRKHDLTAPSSDPQDIKEVPTNGGSAKYRQFIGDELRPWVAANLRSDGHAALMGESLAGLFVVETFLKQPALFDTYVAISPSLWWDRLSLAKSAPARLAAQAPGPRRLYLSLGDEGPGMGLEPLLAALKTAPPKDLTWRYDPRPEEHHNTIYHPAAGAALRWLYPAPK
jgi:predicted alpha/beta superfamily hydrolase